MHKTTASWQVAFHEAFLRGLLQNKLPSGFSTGAETWAVGSQLQQR